MQLDLDTGKRRHLLDQVAYSTFLTGTQVVHRAAFTVLQQLKIRLHHIANVEEVTRDIDIAHLQLRRLQPLTDTDDLPRHIRNDEGIVFAPGRCD